MQKIITGFLFLLFFAAQATAQDSVDLKIMELIREQGLKHSKIELFAHHLTDGSGPRLTNSPGYNRALQWLISISKEFNFSNPRKEAWGEFGKGWSNEYSALSMRKPYFEDIIAYPVPWTLGTAAPVEAEVILIDDLDSASIDKLGASIKGKIVMVKPQERPLRFPFEPYAKRYGDSSLDHLPPTYMFARSEIESFVPYLKREYYCKLYLAKKGAVALINSNRGSRDGTVFVQGGTSYAKGYAATLPEMAMSIETSMRIARFIANKGKVSLSMNVKNVFYNNDLTGYNFVAEIPGTDPVLKNEVVMLGGHLDSWTGGTGATDNAAGCIVMMEAMRILNALPVKPKRTIRIALWGGEEQGLYGSFGYVKKHFGNPADMQLKPEQQKISAYYNLDNGTGKIRGIYAQGNEAVVPIFKNWLAPFADLGANGGVTLSSTGSTDHVSFDAVGIPGFQFIQDPMEYETRTHHSNMDTYEHLSIPDLQQAAVIVAAFVYNTAMRTELMPRKPLPKAERFVFDFDFPL